MLYLYSAQTLAFSLVSRYAEKDYQQMMGLCRQRDDLRQKLATVDNGDGDHCEQDVGGPPPVKKSKRALFPRCYGSKFAASQVPVTGKVLAPDSDEES